MLKMGIGPMSSVWKTEILTTELFKRLDYFNKKRSYIYFISLLNE